MALSIFVELVFYTALGPLLPGLEDRLGLSSFTAGLLVAMYPLGTLTAIVPAAVLAHRVGVKVVALAGLAMIGLMGLVFAVVSGYGALLATRWLQGVGAAGAWGAALAWLIGAAPPARRGVTIGLALGVAAAGSAAGPALGALAAAVGRGPGFGAMSAAALAIFVLGTRLAAPERPPAARLRRALRDREILGTTATQTLPAVLMGATLTLGPLRLADLHSGSAWIGAAFSISAFGTMVARPLSGRWSDRSGRRRPMQAGIAGTGLAFVALSVGGTTGVAVAVVAVTYVAAGFGAVPGVAHLADACERAGVGQVAAATLTNLAFQPGLVIGSLGSGALAALFGTVGACWAVGLAALAVAAAYGAGA